VQTTKISGLTAGYNGDSTLRRSGFLTRQRDPIGELLDAITADRADTL